MESNSSMSITPFNDKNMQSHDLDINLLRVPSLYYSFDKYEENLLKNVFLMPHNKYPVCLSLLTTAYDASQKMYLERMKQMITCQIGSQRPSFRWRHTFPLMPTMLKPYNKLTNYPAFL